MINCDVIQDLLPLYADGLASTGSRIIIEEHIRHCPACKKLADTMGSPIETSPKNQDISYIDAIHAQKRKQRRILLIACFLTILACFIGWWLYMEAHFYGESPRIVTTDEAVIFAEIPQLELTEREKALAEIIFTHPALQSALASDLPTEINTEDVTDLTAAIAREDVVCASVSVLPGQCICVDFFYDDLRIIVEYIDADNTGTVDLIRKTIGILEDDKSANTVYILEYAISINRTWCEKQQMKHIWFSFLNMN